MLATKKLAAQGCTSNLTRQTRKRRTFVSEVLRRKPRIAVEAETVSSVPTSGATNRSCSMLSISVAPLVVY